MARHIRTGDEVVITAGDYKGKSGKIVRVMPKQERVVVVGAGIEGVAENLRPTRINPQGGRVTWLTAPAS